MSRGRFLCAVLLALVGVVVHLAGPRWIDAVLPPVVTGAIVANDDEAVAALPTVLSLNRREVRRRFDERFSAVAMARRYLDLYAGLGTARPERGVALVANA